MTTASKPSGSGSPVSTHDVVRRGRAAPACSRSRRRSRAARTAMPSIADASNDGDERVAHTGAAVTRPTASCRPRRTASTRAGQPRGDARRAPGGERLGGRDVADERRGGHDRQVYSVTSTSVPAWQPGRLVGDDDVAVGGASGSTAAPRRRTAARRRRRARRPGRCRGARRPTGTSRVQPGARRRLRRRLRDAADEPHDRHPDAGGTRRAPSAGCPAAR